MIDESTYVYSLSSTGSTFFYRPLACLAAYSLALSSSSSSLAKVFSPESMEGPFNFDSSRVLSWMTSL
jgi:hypothetical protein